MVELRGQQLSEQSSSSMSSRQEPVVGVVPVRRLLMGPLDEKISS